MSPQSQPTDLILSKTKELLDQLHVQAEASVVFDEQTQYYNVQLETDAPGLIIGYRGETLAAFQLILSLILNHQTDEWHKLIVNVGDYRQRREATLSQLAKNAAQRVAFSGEPYVFDALSPSERRVVHLALQEHPQITTYSQGEGRNRQLVVALK